MKRLAGILTAVLLMLMLTPLHVHAEYTYEESLAALLDASGAAELMDNEPLTDGIDPSDPASLTSISPGKALAALWEMLLTALRTPLQMLTLTTGVILLCSLAGSLQDESGGTGAVYEIVCVLCAVAITAAPISEAFLQAAQALSRTADFMLTFSAVYGGVIAIGGGITTGTVWQGVMVVLCEIALQLSTKLLLPVLSMALAMSIVDAVNPAISLSGLIKLLQKTAAWILGLVMALFLGLLSVQSIVAVSADRAGTKAAKYMISGAVPIVGGAVSDAYSAVMGSIGVLKSSVGMIGILVILSLLLPSVLSLAVIRFMASAAAALSELFSVSHLTKLFQNMESVLAVGFSVSVSFSVMFLFSTAVMMLLGGQIAG